MMGSLGLVPRGPKAQGIGLQKSRHGRLELYTCSPTSVCPFVDGVFSERDGVEGNQKLFLASCSERYALQNERRRGT